MRILLLCPFFPPENKIAAVRIAKFAEHWARSGAEVRVLTRTVAGEELAVPVDENLSVYRVKDPFAKPVSGLQRFKPTRPNLFHRFLGAAYAKSLSLVWPDIFGRWAKAATRETRRWDWNPDVVVASVGPFSALIAGNQIARHFNAKLVVDYRDLLTLSTYYQHGRLRRWFDGRLEGKIAAQASLLATVSDPLAEDLRNAYGRPAIVVTNGFDPRDFAPFTYTPVPRVLTISYCGWVIPQRRDPRPFLEGIAKLKSELPQSEIAVNFYGPPSAEVAAVADELGLSTTVAIHGKVSHEESLKIQANSDVLLLLLWNDPGEAGVLSGKVFEYIGAKRPILMTGFENGAAGQLITENHLGLVSNDPDEIAMFLREKVEEKQQTGGVASPGGTDTYIYTRDAQSQLFLDAICAL